MPELVTPRIERPPEPSPLPGYLTTAQIAARAGIWQDYVGELIREGKLAAIRVGKMWLVKEKDWQEYEKTKKPWGMPRGPRKRKRKKSI